MKRIFLLFFILGVISCDNSDNSSDIQLANCLPSNLQNGVILFYPFTNGSIDDESGNDYHLTNSTSASPTLDRDGNIECAFSFNSDNNEFLEFTNPTFLDGIENNTFSISLWYNSESAGGFFVSRHCFPLNCPNEMRWHVGSGDNNWPITRVNENSKSGIIPNNNQLNEWHHLAVTSNNSNLEIYQDGLLIDSSASTSGDIPVDTNASDLLVGDFHDGILDDIIIYDRILSQTEITELANLPACCN